MPMVRTALNSIKSIVFENLIFYGAGRQEISGTVAVPAPKFFGATGTIKKPQTISAWDLVKFFQNQSNA
jgi:hypothetical protein